MPITSSSSLCVDRAWPPPVLVVRLWTHGNRSQVQYETALPRSIDPARFTLGKRVASPRPWCTYSVPHYCVDSFIIISIITFTSAPLYRRTCARVFARDFCVSNLLKMRSDVLKPGDDGKRIQPAVNKWRSTDYLLLSFEENI